MGKSTVYHVFVLLIAAGIYQHDIKVTATVVGEEECPCRNLTELLVQAKVQWLNNTNKVSELEGKVQKLEKQVETLTRPRGQTCNLPIAFFARRRDNTLVASEKTVDFADVVTDTCNTFDKTTGRFTCPTPGVYVFHVVLLDQGDCRLNLVELVKNGQRVAITWSRGKYSDQEMSGNTAILNLAKGDVVYVRAVKDYPSQPFQTYSTFSGFKVY